MHHCPTCDEPCDCHEILLGQCVHCALDDYADPIGDEMEDDDDDDDEDED